MSVQKKAAYLSLVVSFFVFSLKAFAYLQTRSLAIMSDALESVVNVVTAVVALAVIRVALAPADDDHPYGHGKIEHFSASFEGGLILFAALLIIYESGKKLIYPEPITNLAVGIFYSALATLINLGAGLYVLNVGKKNNSEALKASGKHLLSDVFTTVAIMIGLGLVMITGFHVLDPIVGVIAGCWLSFEAYKIIRENFSALLDRKEPEVVKQILQAIEKAKKPALIDVHNLRMIRSGGFHHIDAHVVVPEFWNLNQVDELTHEFENKVVKSYSYDGEFAFHIDPCKRQYCSICEMAECPVRKKPFVAIRPLTDEGITSGPRHTD